VIWPPIGCEKRESGAEPWIRLAGSDVEVEQMVGGTRGTDYVYVMLDGSLANVRYLPGARLVAKEDRGRNRRREVYRVPKSIIADKPVVKISFSNSGYMFLDLYMVREEGIESYSCPQYEDICRELALRFKFIGEERQLAEFYINFIPKLVDEIKSILKKSNARGIFFARHASRLEETFNDPHLSLFTSMALDTWQGRALSLQERISHVVELWVLAKVVEAVDGETIGDEWWVEFTSNHPLARITSRNTGREYAIFYQPSIYPHTISAFLPERKRLHVVPDVVVFEGLFQYLGWGMLHELVEKGDRPLLVIEVKSGIETSEWRRPEYVLKQLEAYKRYLKPKRIALAVLTRLREPSLRTGLRGLGVDVYEDLLSPEIQAGFAQYVRDALK